MGEKREMEVVIQLQWDGEKFGWAPGPAVEEMPRVTIMAALEIMKANLLDDMRGINREKGGKVQLSDGLDEELLRRLKRRQGGGG